ncbi:hypothetical protein LXM60_12585 [Pandoraea sputorum]|uniref:hypothetical protein n=1 Tax=Pandoraea sputorum TaxID=93222 RepID=UPI001E2A9747|nr:hypothetical protein [Pandoraea sputorum]MCE4061041.1 hypothetical protein [Pandoraea sputorum]
MRLLAPTHAFLKWPTSTFPDHVQMLLVEPLPEDLANGLPRPFGTVSFRGVLWDLSHLSPFAFSVQIAEHCDVSVLVLFSCHCFTKSFRWDARPIASIPTQEIYTDGRERRVLCPERYALSRKILRKIVLSLGARRITLADDRRPNFVTHEHVDALGRKALYAVFFEVERDRRRKRLILRVQSAYVLEGGLTRRQREAKKIALITLLRNIHKGSPIRA